MLLTLIHLRGANSALLRALSRVTSSGRYLPEVDGLRLLAISAVFLCHMNAYFGRRSPAAVEGPTAAVLHGALDSLGRFGVLLFFVVSGFILGVPFAAHRLCAREPVSLRAYYLRRLTRLEPPYLLVMTALLVPLRLVNHVRWAELLPHWVASCLYLHNVAYKGPSTINCVAWSLEIEVQF